MQPTSIANPKHFVEDLNKNNNSEKNPTMENISNNSVLSSHQIIKNISHFYYLCDRSYTPEFPSFRCMSRNRINRIDDKPISKTKISRTVHEGENAANKI